MNSNEEPKVEEEGGQEADVDGEDTSQSWSSPFGDLQELVEDFVDGFRGLSPTAYVRYPRMEMAATDDSYIVWMDLPGVDSDDLQVSALGDELTVSGHRHR
ncbi:MAG: Hsp20 family protein, partial [Gemmatimonadota bacterium]